MSKKIFVLDTNVILSDPLSIFAFEDNDIIIPMIVLEELDKFKKDFTNIGFAARQFSREIDLLRQKGSLIEGVTNSKGGLIKVIRLSKEHLDNILSENEMNNDNIILATALHMQKTNFEQLPVIVVSRDINVRIKADVLGIQAETYTTDSVNMSTVSKGYEYLTVSSNIIDKLFKDGTLELNDLTLLSIHPNKYVILQSDEKPQHQGICRFDEKKNQFIKMKNLKSVLGIKPRNLEQKIAMDLLMNPDIKLVSLIGKAGCGKTLISLACTLNDVVNDGNYLKLNVARPITPMGNDLGFLPGTLEEKLKPWTQPIIDNLDFIMTENQSGIGKDNIVNVQDLFDDGTIKVEALTYIRGRSIPNQIILIDDSQNISAFEMKTIISRAGEGTKIILTGDPYQIDNPYLSLENNGLIYVIDKLKHSGITGHIVLEKGERSELANLAAEYL